MARPLSPAAVARRILGGLAGTLRRITLVFALAALLGLLAFLLAFPLWYFSSRHRTGYTVFVLAALAAFLLFLLARRLQRQGRLYGGLGNLARLRILPPLRTAALVVISLAWLYAIVLLFSRLILAAAIPLAVFFLLFLGYIFYGRSG